MLSNKMKVFVVLAIVFAFATSQVFAGFINAGRGKIHVNWGTGEGKNPFFVFANSEEAESNFINNQVYGAINPPWSNLKTSLGEGGVLTVSLAVPTQTYYDTAGWESTLKYDVTDEELAKYKHSVVITEVMWGTDAPDTLTRQWYEIYSNSFNPKKNDSLVLKVDRNLDPVRSPAPGETWLPRTEYDKARVVKYVVLDRVSTTNRWGQIWELKGNNGDTDGNAKTGTAPVPMVSMYRKLELDSTGRAYALNADKKLKSVPDGREASSWEASTGRVNMTGISVGSPGFVHFSGSGSPWAPEFKMTPASISDTGIIINEVRNDSSDENLDWIELFYNSNNASDPLVNIKDWELSLVMAKMKDGGGYHESGDANFTDTSLAVLPEYKMKPGEYLVIYNRDPEGSVTFAMGKSLKSVSDGSAVNMGADHKYVVAKDLKLPATGKFLILLRTRNHADDVGKPTNIKDYAGNGFFKRKEAQKFNTEVWPFVGWAKPGDVDDTDFGGMNTFASQNMSFGRGVQVNSLGKHGAKSRANRVHKDDWQSFGFIGTGYDRGKDRILDTMIAPGTPGYPNVAVSMIADDRNTSSTDDDYAFDGKVSISEIMYDAGPRSNLVQWIELYNSSKMDTVNLEGWELQISNEDKGAGSYVDAMFMFAAGTHIPPNQTLLLVSSTGTNDVADNYVYNLQEKHRSSLGLATRGRLLLSADGFHLELRAKVNKGGRSGMQIMDEAGNLTLDGATRMHAWDLPEKGEVRMSIMRKYNGSSNPDDGLMQDSWRQSDSVGASLTFYGHRSDVGTPGHRVGSPLPVSLSSFRPVRNASTGHVEITWITQSELNNAGFNILRSESKAGGFKAINSEGLIAGHGTTSEKHVYRYTDTTAKPNAVYYYQIEDVSMDGVRTTLRTTHLRGDVSANGKLTTRWGELKSSGR